jgi:hypothetical protein
VQILEDHTHHFFHGKNAEVAHIKDKAKCNSSEAKDLNNHLHLSRYLHEAFDGINTIPSQFPWFLVHYVSHDDDLNPTSIRVASSLIHRYWKINLSWY